MNIPERVAALRKQMQTHGLGACVIPGTDPHQSENPPAHWKVREWISGFTGSAGTVVVTADKAGLWTDGRYFIQAARQLEGSGIDLFKQQQPGVPEITAWLKSELPSGGKVGIDGRLFPAQTIRDWKRVFHDRPLHIETGMDLIGPLWTDRPALPEGPVRDHPVSYAGRSRGEKLADVRKRMTELKADGYLLASLDDIAWLLNVRADDQLNTPVVTSYLYVTLDGAAWFVEPHRLGNELRQALERDGVTVHPYGEITSFLRSLSRQARILINPKRINQSLAETLPETGRVEEPDLTTAMKAVKNAVEIDHLKTSLVHDAVALARLFCWLEEALSRGQVTELDVSAKMEALRREHPECEGPSFPSIAAYGDHAALMHYMPTPQSDRELRPEGFFLLDSGGQYPGGTTDLTRTAVLGPITEAQRQDYTLVVKGVIQLSTTRFLKGSSGIHLDAIARRPLWAQGRNYGCGTGHGIGFNLCVHEGPHGFSQHAHHGAAFEPGMVVTVEPGVYLEGRYGIRTENMLLVQEDITTEDGSFLRFETINFVPIDTRGIDPALLAPDEIAWLNTYHQRTYDLLQDRLSPAERTWLRQRTMPVG